MNDLSLYFSKLSKAKYIRRHEMNHYMLDCFNVLSVCIKTEENEKFFL